MNSLRSEEGATEIDSFLPDSNVEMTTTAKYKISVISGKKGKESVHLDGINGKPFDPFKERSNPNPTTDAETFAHLLKASLGSGILSMPYAFACAGLTTGLVATIITAVVCTYCSYILVKCAHTLYYRTRVSTLSYADIAEVSFANGPACLRPWSKFARLSVMVSLFVTYFGAISVYTVIAGSNFKEVIEQHIHEDINIRVYIMSVLPILILLGLIPNLKALAPFSAAANCLIVTGLGITIYYLVFGMKSPSDMRQIPQSLTNLPATFSITVFAMEAIGLMMPLENNMKNPTHFLGLCGVLNMGMSVVSMFYIIVGFIGFLRYGDDVKDNITASLPRDELGPQVARICIGISVLLTYVLQYFVCLEIGWNAIKDRFVKQSNLYNSLFRTFLVCASVFLAVAIPSVGAFVGLIGAFCFSFLGILFPVIIEIVTYWETDSVLKLAVRNLPVILFGIMALCFGTYTSILDIVKMYTPLPEVLASNNTLLSNATARSQ